jgi:hypothetical protein
MKLHHPLTPIAVLFLLRVKVHLHHPKNNRLSPPSEVEVLSCLTSFQEYSISLATAFSGKALHILAYSLPLSYTLCFSSPKDIIVHMPLNT